MSDSVIPERREVMLMLPTSPVDFARFKDAMDCCGLIMGLEGCGQVGCGVDMQSEGATGSRWERSSFGVSALISCGEFGREEALDMSGEGVPSE